MFRCSTYSSSPPSTSHFFHESVEVTSERQKERQFIAIISYFVNCSLAIFYSGDVNRKYNTAMETVNCLWATSWSLWCLKPILVYILSICLLWKYAELAFRSSSLQCIHGRKDNYLWITFILVLQVMNRICYLISMWIYGHLSLMLQQR